MATDDRRLVEALTQAWLLGAAARCMLADGASEDAPIDAAARDVLVAAGIRVDPGPESRVLGRALRSQLAQIVAVADASTVPDWGDLDDETLLSQGRASAGLWSMLAGRDGPLPSALRDRLGAPDAAFLDVGTGVGGICAALCRTFPHLTCVGVDILPRALALADAELTTAGVRDRVQLREQDVQDLTDTDAFDVAWVPLPLLDEAVAQDAVSRVCGALRPGGWLVVAANRPDPHPDDVQDAVSRLRVLAVKGCRALRDEVRGWLDAAGAVDVLEMPSPPQAPVILVGRVTRS